MIGTGRERKQKLVLKHTIELHRDKYYDNSKYRMYQIGHSTQVGGYVDFIKKAVTSLNYNWAAR
jgi:hypothetical protein